MSPDGSCDASLSDAGAWGEGGYSMDGYATAREALDAYAAFHAHARERVPSTYDSLVFVPNQYGLGNRLRAMKSALLVAMLTGRVFFARWDEPFPLASFAQPASIDWREPAGKLPHATPQSSRGSPSGDAYILCLPFATAPAEADCARGHANLMNANLSVAYERVPTLEVHTFTDLFIFLSKNPAYERLLERARCHVAPALPRRPKRRPARRDATCPATRAPPPSLRFCSELPEEDGMPPPLPLAAGGASAGGP
jgi:hypothetical protein